MKNWIFKNKIWVALAAAIVLIAVLTVILLMSVSEDKVLESKTYSFSQPMMLLAYQEYYSNYIETNTDHLASFGIDPSKPLDGQTSKYHFDDNGQPMNWRDIMVSDTIDDIKQKLQLCEAAKVAGHTLSQEEKTELEAKVNSFNIGKCGIEGLTKEEVSLYFEICALAQSYKDRLFDDITVTDEEIASQKPKEETFSKNVRHILISYDTDNAEQKAKDLLAEWKKGDATEDSFAALAKEHTEDPATQSSGGLYQNVRRSEMVKGFDTWVYDQNRKAGDTDIITTEHGYHIMYFVGDGEAEWKIYARGDLRDEKYSELLTNIYTSYQIDVNQQKIDKLFQ